MELFSQPLFAVTIALREGCSTILEPLILVLDDKFDQGVMVTEHHKSGKLHIHCMVYRDVKQPVRVTEIFQRFLKSQNVEVNKASIKTKRANDPAGWVAYLNKGHTKYRWLKGYKETWMKRFEVDLKKMSDDVLNSDEYHVCRTSFVCLFEKYAGIKQLKYNNKMDVMNICKRMSRDGYQFGTVWSSLKGLTAEVLNRVGSNEADDEWERAFGIQGVFIS